MASALNNSEISWMVWAMVNTRVGCLATLIVIGDELELLLD